MRHLVTLLLLLVIFTSAYQIGSGSIVSGQTGWASGSQDSQALGIRNFVEDVDFVIQAQIFTQQFKDTVPATSSVILSDLNSPLTLGYGANQSVVPASLYKLFTAWYVYEDLDNGALSTSDRIDGLPLSECLRLMIVISDNDCATALSEEIGWEELDARIAADGYSATQINNYDDQDEIEGDKQSSSGDIARLLKRLYDGDGLSDESRQAFIDLLSAQEIVDRIPDNLPDGVSFAFKTGNLLEVSHDAGYIFGPNGSAYIFVIMTSDWEDNAFIVATPYVRDFISDTLDILPLN